MRPWSLLLLLWWGFLYASALTFFTKSKRGLGGGLVGAGWGGQFWRLCFALQGFVLVLSRDSVCLPYYLLPVTDFQHFFVDYLFIYLF
jgi:hypothetical protein